MKRFRSSILIVFLLTSSTIIFEISLSRLLSYMLSYHFVLIIIAFSILGIGVGQIIYSQNTRTLGKSITTWYYLLPTSMLISYFLLLIIPKINFILSIYLGLVFFAVLSILPFIVIGIVYAHLFEESKTQVSLLYGIDMLGAASGALLSVLMLNALNLASVIGIAVLLLFLAFIIHSNAERRKYSKTLLISFIVIIPLFWFGKDYFDFKMPLPIGQDKDMTRLLSNPAIESEVIESRWTSFGKTDLVKLSYPDGNESEIMFIDGAAGTEVINLDEWIRDTIKMRRELSQFPALFSMSFLDSNETDTALVIGPGGGIDIAAAWVAGFDFIEAVEVNPSFVELMGIYNRPTFFDKENIKVYTNEARNFIRNQKGKYDAIFLTIPVTKSTRGADFYGLTENYLFTVDALSDYLDKLTEEGAVLFTMHSKHEVLKMLSNYLELQQSKGIDTKEAFKQIYIISNGMNPVFVIKKRPFDSEIIEEIHASSHEFGLDNDVFFFPYLSQVFIDTIIKRNINYQWYMFDKLIYDISKGKFDYSKLWEASLMNLSPVFDDTPYFFNYSKGIPDSMNIPFWLSIAIIGWFWWEWKHRRRLIDLEEKQPKVKSEKLGWLMLIAFLLGFSYFFLQAYIFQILNLKLSNPTESFSLLLFTFLLGNGLGSLLTVKFKKSLPKKLMIFTFLIPLVSILTIVLLVPGIDTWSSKAGVAAILILPSFFIGIPFPVLLKIATDFRHKNTIPTLLGVSSIAGVGSSIFAVIVSILFGYTIVFFIGLLGYFLVVISAYRLNAIENEIEIRTKIKSLS